MPWARRTSKPIPSIGSRKLTLEINDFSRGANSFLSNDKFPLRDGDSNFWRDALNARISTLGEYGTRKGVDYHSDAAGITKDDNQESVTGADTLEFSTTDRIAQPFTTSSAGVLAKINVRMRNVNSATGTPIIEVWSDDAGAPGTMLDRTSIHETNLTSSFQYLSVRFPQAPSLSTATTYWIVIYVQATGTGAYEVSTTTNDTDALVSTDSGSTWSAASVDINFQQYYATSGGVKGVYRAYKSDGTAKTLFAHGTSLYSVDDVTGALTAIKTGLNASATHYRFETVNDTVYYVNGFDGLRKWDFTTESQVNATNYTLIRVHKGLLFLVEKNDPNKMVFSNFADYETFTSTDFIYVPAPKTGDPVTALVSLNGYMIIPTLKNKFILSGDDNATFTLDEAPDQKGTYTQETITQDDNFIYFLSDDGVYRSNGSEPQLLSKNNYQDIKEIVDKDSSCMIVHKGRLYLWHSQPALAYNDRCWVWNLRYGSSDSECVESLDTNACIQRAYSAFRDERLLVGCSILGRAYWQELDSNDYTNNGGDIDFELATHYMTFNSPSVLKEIRYWQPRFEAQSGNYTISCEYATDLRDNWQTYSTPNVQGSGAVWGSGITWGSFTWGATAETQSYLYVPGEYRRIALRYKHYATRQPHTFLGHSLVAETRRMR